ncbi:MAG: ABC transporter substrate-binding protein [Thermoguttaceae bacterium]|jgi:iron complex transport system substrate-binding protein
MKKRSGRSWFRAGTAALLCLLSFFLGCQRPTGRPAETKGGDTDPPRRIVSVVPSVTETLFALGLGDRVVGVSDFCRYPPEARELPKLGGMHNTNLERIVELRPDLAVLLREHHELKEKLEKVQIATLSVDHSSIAGILDSFEEIADGCGVGEAGRKLRHQTEERLEALRPEPEKEPVRVLIVLDRDLGERNITQVYVAGKNRYFNDLLKLAGGKNVLAETSSMVPTVSREGILEKNPEVIFDLSSLGADDPRPASEREPLYRHDWDSLGNGVAAIRDGRVYPVLADYATIPGPRFILFAELLSDMLRSDENRGSKKGEASDRKY